MSPLCRYGKNLLIGIDQLANCVFGGSPDDTISSRLGRNYPNSLMRKVVDALFHPIQKHHCKESIEPDDRDDDAILK